MGAFFLILFSILNSFLTPPFFFFFFPPVPPKETDKTQKNNPLHPPNHKQRQLPEKGRLGDWLMKHMLILLLDEFIYKLEGG